jgi:hypothetical protein
LVSMQLRKLLTFLIVALVAFTLVPRAVSVSYADAKITNVVAPNTVVAGQPVTVSITTSYSMNTMALQVLSVAIIDRPNPNSADSFPITATSCPSSGSSSNPQSICSYAPGITNGWSTGDFTVSFTLTAPNYATTWNLYLVAEISQFGNSSPISSNLMSVVARGPITTVQILVTAG